MQVLAVLNAVLKQVKIDFSELEETMIGSDNASCIASHDSIPFMHHLNQNLNNVNVRNWACTKARTGKNRLDSHFSFASLK